MEILDGTQVCVEDPSLKPYCDIFQTYHESFLRAKDRFLNNHGSLYDFATGHKFFGIQKMHDGRKIYREWLPAAQYAALIGEFNNWDPSRHGMQRDENGVWSIIFDDHIPHLSKIRVHVKGPDGKEFSRIPAYLNKTTHVQGNSFLDGVYYDPPQHEIVAVSDVVPPFPSQLHIYESHVGIATEEQRVGTYREFADNVLHRVKSAGYNVVQLMAIAEHSFYASFGYQVTSFFAPSYRFGSPDDLRYLINKAHEMGLLVIMDICHSHSSSNTFDGLSYMDGSDSGYFHSGKKGYHEQWDSRIFNYDSYETVRFLLSNLRYWVEEFGFDGFRFDAVTSMLYTHHGIGVGFTGEYHEYFSGALETSAVVYMKLAHELLHSSQFGKRIISIAEDVSGLPTLCRPIESGGLGFDFRLGMAIPDLWIKLLKEKKDDEWELGHIVYILQNRRHLEPVIAYAESHDQALVGDKTLIFWLLDKLMYTEMSILSNVSEALHRGIHLIHLIQALTYILGGEAYLNFMGNEFGHPEWLDFPCERNEWSYHYARRQWSLSTDKLLRYQHVLAFHSYFMQFGLQHNLLASMPAFVTHVDELRKLIFLDRNNFVFVFNFNHSKSISDLVVPVRRPGKLTLLFHSDAVDFGGHARLCVGGEYFTFEGEFDANGTTFDHCFKCYSPNRTLLVFGYSDLCDERTLEKLSEFDAMEARHTVNK
ncbi:hypothetical protein PCE1_000957 [Barthelona sp. PCE]